MNVLGNGATAIDAIAIDSKRDMVGSATELFAA